MPTLHLAGAQYGCEDGETVLQALLRQQVDLPFSCKIGSCQTCLMRAEDGDLPTAAHNGLRDSLSAQGYFLPCVCTPAGDLHLSAPNDADIFGRATVAASERLAPAMQRVVLHAATPLYYHAGQFLNLRRGDALVRSYSLASVPRLEETLELHVKRLPRGLMSNWIHDELQPGDSLDIQGPNGDCFYVPGREAQDLLLIGNGSGLAPLYGVARDALHGGHNGEVRLYHGSRSEAGLYLRAELAALAKAFDNFHYHACVSGDAVPDGCRAGRAESVAFQDLPVLNGWRVFLCGYPPMVNAARKKAYILGVDLKDIYADPFDLRDLRAKPRD